MAHAAETTPRQSRNGMARNALRSRAGDVLDDFGTLRKDMSKLAQAANKAARTEVKHAGRKLEEMGRELRSRAGARVETLSEQVRERPAASLGVAAGFGLLLGLMLSARR